MNIGVTKNLLKIKKIMVKKLKTASYREPKVQSVCERDLGHPSLALTFNTAVSPENFKYLHLNSSHTSYIIIMAVSWDLFFPFLLPSLFFFLVVNEVL